MAKESVDQRMLAMTRARMYHEPGWFIDDDHIRVFEKDLERNRLRLIVELLERRLG